MLPHSQVLGEVAQVASWGIMRSAVHAVVGTYLRNQALIGTVHTKAKWVVLSLLSFSVIYVVCTYAMYSIIHNPHTHDHASLLDHFHTFSTCIYICIHAL